MTKYAFVIDQRKCIGCHACTVACKAEHDVPIGVYRTWVKYIEKGEFPNSRRYFLVNRCNHCDDAPCVAICPTKALYKRKDGIVDFDSTHCGQVQLLCPSYRGWIGTCLRHCLPRTCHHRGRYAQSKHRNRQPSCS